MKTKKILSVILAIVMLFTCTSVLTSATGTPASAGAMSFTNTVETTFNKGTTVDRNTFGISVVVDESKFCAIDGETDAYTYTIDSAVIKGTDINDNPFEYDYYIDAESFFNVFSNTSIEKSTLAITTTINFESDKVFGKLEYGVNVTGFSAPLKVGMGPIDDQLANTSLPIKVELKDSVPEFPYMSSIDSIVQAPSKQEYVDNEKFDLTGTKITVSTEKVVSTDIAPNGDPVYTYGPAFSGTITYSKDNAALFTCNPAKNENLTVDTKEVYTYFDGFKIGNPLPVKVDHAWSNGYVSISTDKYTDANPGYHAIVCDGCGKAHDAQKHVVDPNTPWESDGNSTFVENGTEHNTCTVCGATLTRDVFHSAGYNDAFEELHFLRVIFDYVNALLRIIRAAIGKF